MNYNNYIIDILRDKDISLLGFADLSEINSEQRQGLKYGICIAIALGVFPSEGDTPSRAYYDEYQNVSAKLKEISLYIEKKIIEKGYKAYSLAGNVPNEDFRTILPIKTLATRSGLGWIGKSSTLITKEYGNAIRLGGIITDMPFETAEPISTSYCGSCSECVKYCPANAIAGINWDTAKDRSELLDPFLCRDKASERGKKIGVAGGNCGICISVCPWTKKYMEKKLAE